jgi:hypothetical protein
MFSNFEGGHTSNMVSLELSLTPILIISVKTETIDYISPFTSRSPYKFCLRRGEDGGSSTQLWGKCEVQGFDVVPVKTGRIRHNMSDETATLSRTVMSQSPYMFCVGDPPQFEGKRWS